MDDGGAGWWCWLEEQAVGMILPKSYLKRDSGHGASQGRYSLQNSLLTSPFGQHSLFSIWLSLPKENPFFELGRSISTNRTSCSVPGYLPSVKGLFNG